MAYQKSNLLFRTRTTFILLWMAVGLIALGIILPLSSANRVLAQEQADSRQPYGSEKPAEAANAQNKVKPTSGENNSRESRAAGDDTLSYTFEALEIQATRIYKKARYQPVAVHQLDSLEMNSQLYASIDQVISQFSPAFIKNNGPGAISTISQRGHSARHTQILWNGLEMSNPMLGETDLSYIPTAFFNKLEVTAGNGSSAYGSGAVGGTINLSNRVDRNQAGLQQTVGSYGRSRSHAQVALTEDNWNLGVNLQYENSENDFSYTTQEFSNEEGGWVDVEKQRRNNRLKSYQGMLNGGYQGEDVKVKSALWFNDITNHTPGSIQSPTLNSYQENKGLRWAGEVRIENLPFDLKMNTGLSRQQLNYFNPSNDLDSRSTSRKYDVGVEARYSLLYSLQLKTVADFSRTSITTNNYAGEPSRNQYGVMAQTTWHPWMPLHIYGAMRSDWYSTGKQVWSPSLGYNLELVEERLYWKGQYSYNYRLPTFNDLYWKPGGNPDLQPERSRKLETGLSYHDSKLGGRGTTELTLFAGRMRNGIRWRPDDQSGFWEPINLERIFSRGAELSLQRHWEWGNGYLKSTALGSYTRSTMDKERFEGDKALDKQLVYVPEWSFKGSLQAKKGLFLGGITGQWNDKRYTTFDHSGTVLPEFGTLSAHLGITYSFGEWRLRTTVKANNLTGADYSEVQNYPMPGRNYHINAGINYHF